MLGTPQYRVDRLPECEDQGEHFFYYQEILQQTKERGGRFVKLLRIFFASSSIHPLLLKAQTKLNVKLSNFKHYLPSFKTLGSTWDLIDLGSSKRFRLN